MVLCRADCCRTNCCTGLLCCTVLYQVMCCNVLYVLCCAATKKNLTPLISFPLPTSLPSHYVLPMNFTHVGSQHLHHPSTLDAGAPNQLWKYNEDSGSYESKLAPGLVIDIPGAKTKPGIKLITWEADSGAKTKGNQRFTLPSGGVVNGAGPVFSALDGIR